MLTFNLRAKKENTLEVTQRIMLKSLFINTFYLH